MLDDLAVGEAGDLDAVDLDPPAGRRDAWNSPDGSPVSVSLTLTSGGPLQNGAFTLGCSPVGVPPRIRMAGEQGCGAIPRHERSKTSGSGLRSELSPRRSSRDRRR